MSWWLEPVPAPCEKSRAAALARQQQLTKPPGSLGRLEELAVQFAAWQGRSDPQMDKIDIRIFAGDHGVVAEGVSAFPQSVTGQMIHNFASGGAAIAVLARQLEASFAVINLGTAESLPALEGVTNLALASGTNNFCEQAAMSQETVQQALTAGAAQVNDKCHLFVGGEMGIGNTTAAAALSSALLGLPVEQTVGRGTGIDDRGLSLKRDAVQRALDLHMEDDIAPQDILQRLGGLEIAALTGAYIAAAQHRIPILVDGYICSTAALVACRLNPEVRHWMVFAHQSTEPGHQHLLQALSAQPLLDFGMRLGEGSGAAVAVPLLRAACQLHNQMATFAEAGVSDGQTS